MREPKQRVYNIFGSFRITTTGLQALYCTGNPVNKNTVEKSASCDYSTVSLVPCRIPTPLDFGRDWHSQDKQMIYQGA